MAHHPQALSLAPAQWDQDAEHWLAQALAGATLESLRDQVAAGASLFHVLAGQAIVGAFLLRIDQTTRGPEGVVVAGAGQLAGVDMLETCLPAIERLFLGVTRYRIHTARPGLVRKLARQGYRPREIVCYKEITT